MDIIIAILFGAVQGIAEFVPVSSSGHLVLLHNFFPGFEMKDALGFDVALHVGTVISLLFFFWKDILRYLSAAFRRTPKSDDQKEDRRVAWLMVLAMIPAGIVGFVFEDIIEQTFRSPYVVVVMLIVVALVFIAVERIAPKRSIHPMESLTWKTALLIGVAQVLALVPGTSRSGITMVAGMGAGLKRDVAARFTFLMSIPLILGAGLKKTADLITMGVVQSEIPLLVVGVVSSAIVGYLAIGYLLSYLKNKTLRPFAAYRIILAIFVLIILAL